MEDQTTKLEMIVQGVSENKALEVKNSLTEFLEKANEWRSQIDSLHIESVKDTAKMKIAREARLFLRNNRLDAKRLTDAKRDEVKAKKLQFDLEDKAWLKAFQLVESVCKELEEAALEKEKYAEKKEEEEKEARRQERWNELSQYTEIEPLGLGEMPDTTYSALLSGIKQQHQEAIEAERKLEEERLEKERKDKLYFERLNNLSKYSDFSANILDLNMADFRNMDEEEYSKIKSMLIDAKNKHEEEQAKIKEENEKLKAKAEAEEKARKEEEEKRKEEDEARRKAAKEKEEHLARIQAELDAEKKREELRLQKEKEQREAEEKARKEALLAPDKDKIISYVNSFEVKTLDLSSTTPKETLANINARLEGWKSWAIKTINETL